MRRVALQSAEDDVTDPLPVSRTPLGSRRQHRRSQIAEGN